MIEARKAWSEEEDKAIKTLVKKYGTHRWTDISKQMEDSYGLDPRSGKQCRERWYNHLNPKINKQPWTDAEEIVLFEAHRELGNKWKRIAERLNGRTDNSIKNHFYSTMRKKLRRINKLMGTRNSTSQVRQIKPSVLSNIFSKSPEGSQEMKEDFGELSKALFEFKLDKSYSRLTKQEKDKFNSIITKINEYNEKYVEEKDEGKRPELTSKASRKKKSQIQQQQQSSQISQEEFEKNQLSEEYDFDIELPELHFGEKQSSMGRNSFLSNQDIIRQEMLTSPMLTRNFIKTPKQPTPRFFQLCPFSNQIMFDQTKTYEESLTHLQKEIRSNTFKKQ